MTNTARLGMLCVIVAMLAGCGVRERVTGILRDETARSLPFKAKLSKGEDRRDYTVTVATPEGPATLDEMRESARYQATKYCLKSFGASDAQWTIDAGTGDWAVARTDKGAVLTGRCTAL
jgi:hypothetical protein